LSWTGRCIKTGLTIIRIKALSQHRQQLRSYLEGELAQEDLLMRHPICEEELKTRIKKRVALSYLPCVSPTVAPEEARSDQKALRPPAPSEDKFPPEYPADLLSASSPVSADFVFRPLEKGTHLICAIHRVKSTLQTTYKLYLEDIVTRDTEGAGAVARPADPKPLLIAKRSHGLSFSCTVFPVLGPSVGPCAKISKTGKYSFETIKLNQQGAFFILSIA